MRIQIGQLPHVPGSRTETRSAKSRPFGSGLMKGTAGLGLLLFLFAGLPLKAASGSAAQYFPLSMGRKWVLKHPVYNAQFTFEVVAASGNSYRVHCTTPWGTSDWQLTNQTTRYAMTAYGTAAGMMPLGNSTIFLDFSSPAGTSWSNVLGQLSVDSRSALFVGGGAAFTNAIRVKQVSQGSTTLMTFVPGVGLAEYSIGDQVFLLDPASSSLPGNAFPAPAPWSTTLPPVGIAPNQYGDQPDTLLSYVDRLQLMASGGSKVLMGYGRWNELEPSPGSFQLDSLLLQMSQARRLNLTAAYTFCIIDMATRNVPPDFQSVPWTDPNLQAQVLQLVSTIAAQFNGQVAWFQFGSEVDTYFQTHPDEVNDFLQLYLKVRTLLQQIAPGMRISVNFKFAALSDLNGYLKPLYDSSDLLVLTYGPYGNNFIVSSPSVPAADILAMAQRAGSRKLFLQEIAYPSSSANGSSQQMQADFYTNVFAALRASRAQIAAASIFEFADVGPLTGGQLAAQLGMSQYGAFVSLIEGLGLFDSSAQPKQSWSVFTAETKR
jgi:hypothetical protein